MKKVISLLLALVMCLSLCACGKSAEAKKVDEMIMAIGEVTIDNASQVEAAMDAYNALSEKDRESVENYAILESAAEELFYIQLFNLTNQLLEVYYNCKHVTDGVRIIWDNVGSSEFWTTYNAVRMLSEDLSKAEYDEIFIEVSGVKAYATIWCAARGLCPSNIYDVNKMTDEAQEKTIDLCVDFNRSYNLISDNMEQISEDVRVFKDKYKKNYEDEVDTLNELCLEISMYVDFALEPSGSLNSYISEDSNYQNSIDRMIKIMDSYK